MNEIKKCPHCGSEVKPKVIGRGLSNRGYEVEFSISCNRCDLKFGDAISKFSVNENGQIETIEDGLSKLIERWNKRAEEPQERKESNIEWALNEIKKGYFYFNACKIANCIKNGKPCGECDECDECEFQYNEDAVDYLLALHEEKY